MARLHFTLSYQYIQLMSREHSHALNVSRALLLVRPQRDWELNIGEVTL